MPGSTRAMTAGHWNSPTAARAQLSPEHVFKGLATELYARCDQIAKVGTLALAYGGSTDEIEVTLEDSERRNLLARSGDMLLSLAVFRARPAMQEVERKQHAAILEPAYA